MIAKKQAFQNKNSLESFRIKNVRTLPDKRETISTN